MSSTRRKAYMQRALAEYRSRPAKIAEIPVDAVIGMPELWQTLSAFLTIVAVTFSLEIYAFFIWDSFKMLWEDDTEALMKFVKRGEAVDVNKSADCAEAAISKIAELAHKTLPTKTKPKTDLAKFHRDIDRRFLTFLQDVSDEVMELVHHIPIESMWGAAKYSAQKMQYALEQAGAYAQDWARSNTPQKAAIPKRIQDAVQPQLNALENTLGYVSTKTTDAAEYVASWFSSRKAHNAATQKLIHIGQQAVKEQGRRAINVSNRVTARHVVLHGMKSKGVFQAMWVNPQATLVYADLLARSYTENDMRFTDRSASTYNKVSWEFFGDMLNTYSDPKQALDVLFTVQRVQLLQRLHRYVPGGAESIPQLFQKHVEVGSKGAYGSSNVYGETNVYELSDIIHHPVLPVWVTKVERVASQFATAVNSSLAVHQFPYINATMQALQLE